MDLISKWQHVLDRVNIPTWTEVLTLAYLAEIASKCNRIIECGTYLGASAKTMLLANPKLFLYCIDTFACKNERMMSDYLHNIGETNTDMTTYEICRCHSLKQEINEGRCMLIEGTSERGAAVLLHEQSICQVDAIFVDDGHQAWQVFDDCRYLLPFLKESGEICGHDYDPGNDVYQGVLASFGEHRVKVPVPRLWSVFKTPDLNFPHSNRPLQ